MKNNSIGKMILRGIAVAFLSLMALVFLMENSILTGLIVIMCIVSLLPIIYEKISFLDKKFIKVALPILLFLIAMLTFNPVTDLDEQTGSENNSGTVVENIQEDSSETYLKIGDSITIDDLVITVNSYKFSKYLGGLDGLNKANDGLEYCVVYITTKNIGTSTKQLYDGLIVKNPVYTDKLIFDDVYEYNSVWANYTDFFHTHEEIPALGEIKTCLCFEVSKDVENKEKSLVLSFGTNKVKKGQEAKWVLR